jgi:energy-coupling factor transporter ATP-binding protein EcfA2/DNA repair exonuclease SbcCD nuclease subunit
MRYLIWSDLHAYPHTVYSRPTERGLTTHIEDLFKTGDWLEELMLDHAPDAMVFLGDYFHAFGQIDMQSLQVLKVWERLHYIAGDMDIPAVALVGNHDYYDTYANIHSLPTAPQVIDTPRVLEFGEDRVLLLPYCNDPAEITRQVREAGEHSLVFAHIPLLGAEFATGATEQAGIDSSVFTEASILVNGHYHMPDEYDTGDDLIVVMAGTVIASSFNDIERDIRHGALILDSDTGEITRFENPHSALFNKFEIYTENALHTMQDETDADADRRVVRVKTVPEYRDLIEQNMRPHLKYLQINALAPELGMEEARSEISVDDSPVKNLTRYIELSECPDDKYGLDTLTQVIAEHPTEAAGEFMLSYVAIENFLSIVSAEYEANDGSLILIEGKNGSGKTALQEAIMWAVYGTSPRSKNKSAPGDDVIYEHGAKSCRVEVEVEIGGELYMIARGRKDRDYKSQPHLFVHNKKQDKFVPADARIGKGTQDKINALVGVPEHMMRQTIFLTQSLENRFTELGDADRKRLLGTLSGASIYEHCEKRARIDLKDAEHEVSQAEGRIGAAEQNRDRHAEQIEAREQELETFDRDNQKQRKALREQRKEYEAEIAELEEKATALTRSIADYNSDFVAQDDAINDISDEIKRAQDSRANLATERAVPLANRDTLERVLGTPVCPTCGQGIDAETYQEQYDDAINEVDRLDLMIEDVASEIVALTEQRNKLMAERRQSMAEQRDLQDEQSTLDRQTLPDRRKRLQRLIEDESRFDDQRRNIETQLNFAKDEYAAAVGAIDSAADDLSAAQDQAAVIAWWIRAFGKEGIVSWLYDEVLVFVNERLREYSDIMFGDIVVSLSSTRELKSGDVKNEIDIIISGGRPYRKLSSGERRRIDLALQFALNDLAVSSSGFRTNLLVCDEIDDYLDWGGKTGLVEILQAKAAAKMFVMLMTHNAELKSLIPKRWYMTNEGGESSLYKGAA